MAGTNGYRGTHNGTAGEQLVGTVEATNERGVKVGGRWLNYSKSAGDITEPRRGQVVALTLDGSGFVRAVAPAEGAATGPHQMPTAGARNGDHAPDVPEGVGGVLHRQDRPQDGQPVRVSRAA